MFVHHREPVPDLSYYNWKTQTLSYNNSSTFQVIADNEMGLFFKHKRDRKTINVTHGPICTSFARHGPVVLFFTRTVHRPNNCFSQHPDR